MLEMEERLLDEFKRVDRICGDLFSCRFGISEYIREMEQTTPYSRYKILCWEEDYRKLKRIRWLRNQIVHETTAVDCHDNDIEWLEKFHARILNQQDPLALLRKQNQAARTDHSFTPSDSKLAEQEPLQPENFEQKNPFPEFSASPFEKAIVVVAVLAIIAVLAAVFFLSLQ